MKTDAPRRVPWPALLICAWAALLVAFSLRRHWYPLEAYDVHLKLLRGVIYVTSLAAALLAYKPAAARLLEPLKDPRPDAAPPWSALGAAFLGMSGFLFFLKWCQYRSFQLPLDTAATLNLLYNVLHHGRFEAPLLGSENYLSVHFMPAAALLAPVLWLGSSVTPFLVLQSAAVASAPIAVFLIARRRAGSSVAGWAALWLCFTSPFLYNLASASIAFQVILPAVFLWGVHFHETGRPRLAAAALLLLLLTIEQTPVLVCGLALYRLTDGGWRDPRKRLEAAALAVAGVLLFAGELALMRALPGYVPNGARFEHLAPSLEGVLRLALTEPWTVAARVVWPPEKLAPLGLQLLSTGLLCLLAPAQLLVWLVNYLPNLLSSPASYYHDLRVHYSAYVVGPLWWALAAGAATAHARLHERGLARAVLALALGAGALNLALTPIVLQPSWSGILQEDVPSLAAKVPPDASVWAFEFAAPAVAARRFIKSVPYGELDPYFFTGNFVPDYLLLARHQIPATSQPFRGRLLTFWAREGYAKAGETSTLVLLKHPRAPLAPPGGRPPALVLPEPGPEADAFYRLFERVDDMTTSLENWRRAADGGEPVAQYTLATFHDQGLGVPRDPEAASRLCRLAAEKGHAEAQTCLGIHLGRVGAPQESIPWFMKAAAQNEPKAAFFLAMCYRDGAGVTADQAAATRWFEAAARLGHPLAQYEYGARLFQGLGGPPDRDQAVVWLRRAAEQGVAPARAALAQMR